MNREDFPMLKGNLIYLDNGATTLKPQCVIDSITDYYTNYSANAHRGDYDISFKVDEAYEHVRSVVKDFIHAKSEKEIIFTSGCTQSLNMIVDGYFKNHLNKDDEVLITLSEHASNVLPWFRLQKEIGIVVKYIPLDDDHAVTLEHVKESINEHTKVISIAGVTNVIGDVRPMKDIINYAHQHHILVVQDGAQSVPHMETNVIDSDVDFLAFSGHKMCGPTGVGVLYGRESLLEELRPQNLGGGMNESFDDPEDVYLKELPTRLEAGTPNIAGVIGLGRAITFLKEIGMKNIHQHELELKNYAVFELSKINHIQIVNPNSKSGIIAFNVKDIFSQDVAYYLNKYHICVRAGNHCAKILKKEIGITNTIRVSLYFYNNKNDIDTLVLLLKDKDKIRNEMI